MPTVYDIQKKTGLEKYFSNPEKEKSVHNYAAIKSALLRELSERTIHVMDAVPYFNQNRAYSEFFLDDHHFLNSGNELMAQFIFEAISQNQFKNNRHIYNLNTLFQDSDSRIHRLLNEKYQNQLSDYFESIEKYSGRPIDKVGSIVVNCNPFTNGHLQIIEYALRQVELLYVFVVQEDDSYFTFKDRMFLVKENTKHLKNIIVNPSGANMISKITFPEYFKKEEMQENIVDCSHDLFLFSAYIAPFLRITKRFIGKEPFCNITRQYNQKMKEILPLYNIEVIEIERFRCNGEYISASKVRKLFKDGQLEIIKELVPKATYQFLQKKKKEIK